MNRSRFIIGIDLGTTNIAVAYCDMELPERRLELFSIPQVIAPGEVQARELFPSFCFIPDPNWVPPGIMALPWDAAPVLTAGTYARDEGARTPSRCIGSAKSWLCHAGVDRRAPILPWGNQNIKEKRSPQEVTRFYLEHLRAAWNHHFGSWKDADGEPCLMENQQVAITVPAGFDETARELTLEAAEQAGLKNILLLEEPLAAFYSWLNRHENDWKQHLAPGESVLVVDIGGGTSDFSLIALDEHGVLSRTAAGEHLLLGGDNIDMAIARQIESGWEAHLSPAEWSALCGQVRAAKERLFSADIEEAPVTLLSQGSSVIANTRKAILKKAEAQALVTDGFLPAIGADAADPARRSGMQTMGLPYAADPAITRHLLAFLRHAARIAGHGDHAAILRPDRILFNGGSMIPEFLRRHIVAVISSWFADAPAIPELESRDLNLAVAYGAAAFGISGRGEGIRVKCGTSRAYYVATNSENGPVYVCVMPRGIEENIRIRCPQQFELEANRKAEFPLYCSSTRLNDQPGDMVSNPDELMPLSTMVGVLRCGGHQHRRLKCGLSCLLTETGILKLAVESGESQQHWPLKFDVRYAAGDGQGHPPATILDSAKTDAAATLLKQSFLAGDVSGIFAKLETQLEMPRKEWPLPLLRLLADTLLEIPAEQRAATADTEGRWLNLAGFCLRPGFGDPEDELRLQQAWKLWYEGMKFPGAAQAAAEWWVFWRRLAPGLRTGHQRTIYQALSARLCPKFQYNPKSGAVQEKTEMWRCLGALELLPPDFKGSIGKCLLQRGKKLDPAELWVLGRLGSRRLFRAPANHTLPATAVDKWLAELLTLAGKNPAPELLFTLSRLAALTGDRGVDVAPSRREQVKSVLSQEKAPPQWLTHLEQTGADDSAEEQCRILGDTLPLGLSLVNS